MIAPLSPEHGEELVFQRVEASRPRSRRSDKTEARLPYDASGCAPAAAALWVIEADPLTCRYQAQSVLSVAQMDFLV